MSNWPANLQVGFFSFFYPKMNYAFKKRQAFCRLSHSFLYDYVFGTIRVAPLQSSFPSSHKQLKNRDFNLI